MLQPHRLLLILGFILCLSRVTAAQPIGNPNYVEFTASADHDAQDSGGQPMLLRYELRLYVAGSSTPSFVVGIGKPAPDTAGTIRLSLTSILNPIPPSGVTYELRIAAVGVGGSAESAPSNTFTFQATTCTYTLSPASRSIGAGGGTSSFSVTAPPGCGWAASESSSWMSITSGASGSGNGTVAFTVDSNSTTSPRNGALTIAGQTAAVDQAAAGCTYTVSPGSRSIAQAGGASTFSVTAPAGCNWTVTENASWITLTSPASGAGNGTVGFTVAANPTTSTRNMTMTIAGQSRGVSQAGMPCTYTVTPTSQAVVRAGANIVFAVNSQAGCNWSASEQSSWLSIASGASGNGSGSVTIRVSANSGTQVRTASATVAGTTVNVRQGVGGRPAAPSGFRVVAQQ